MRSSANQADVARAAGVSVSTVSRALANAPGISPELRALIQKLAGELGYQRRSAAAVGPRLVRAYVTVNVVTGGLVAFYNALVEGLKRHAAAAGIGFEVRLAREAALDPDSLDRDTAESPAMGTLLVGIDVAPAVGARFGRSNPLFLVNTYDPEMRFDSVAPNNFYGGSAAAEMLLSAGHRSLLYVTDFERWTILQRKRGFLAAVEGTAGARASVLDLRGDGDALLAAAIGRRRAGAEDWTGVFCVNDITAIRIVHALEAAGLRVPADVSVVGFDDLPAASMMTPRLSTLRVDCDAIGAEAVALMVRRFSDPDAAVLQIECGVTPIAGASVAPPRRR